MRQLVVGFPTPLRVGGDAMTVYEALSLMIAFATLVVLIICARKYLRHEKNRLGRRFFSCYNSRKAGLPQPVVSLCYYTFFMFFCQIINA